MEEIKIQAFGYSELYEWETIPEVKNKFGRFVTFSKEYPDKIELYGKSNSDSILGITTINSTVDSDDPDDWKYHYLTNEYGDLLLKKERLAVGGKQYDENLEMSFIKTYPWEHLIKITNPEYKEERYVKRSNRNEWIRVNLLGKCIVIDNGNCTPGDYCTPYTGNIKDLYGTAIKANDNSKNKFYVLERISENTILVLNKNIC